MTGTVRRGAEVCDPSIQAHNLKRQPLRDICGHCPNFWANVERKLGGAAIFGFHVGNSGKSGNSEILGDPQIH